MMRTMRHAAALLAFVFLPATHTAAQASALSRLTWVKNILRTPARRLGESSLEGIIRGSSEPASFSNGFSAVFKKNALLFWSFGPSVTMSTSSFSCTASVRRK